jgi:uncharacterized protein (TIGR02466 family)
MSKFNANVYFGTPVWTNEVPEFIKPINKLADKYIKNAKKNLLPILKDRNKLYKRKLGDFGLSNHSVTMLNDPEAKEFIDYCGNRSYEFLEWQGFDLKNHSLHFTELWVQEFSSKGAGHHDTHVHWANHISGFYFLKCSPRTSCPKFHDPRPGRMMTYLPLKDTKAVCSGMDNYLIRPKPGTLLMFNSYLPHEFKVDNGIDAFRFIHFNIKATPK